MFSKSDSKRDESPLFGAQAEKGYDRPIIRKPAKRTIG